MRIRSALIVLALFGAVVGCGGGGYHLPTGKNLTPDQRDEVDAYDVGLEFGNELASNKGRPPIASDCDIHNEWSQTTLDSATSLGVDAKRSIRVSMAHEDAWEAGCMAAGGD